MNMVNGDGRGSFITGKNLSKNFENVQSSYIY